MTTPAHQGSFYSRLYALDLARFAVDMAENMFDPDLFQAFVSTYSQATGLDKDRLLNDMRPYYEKISAKYKKKYGNDVPVLDALNGRLP